MIDPRSDSDRAAIAEHCRRYVERFQQATLPDGRSKIARQDRSLESEKPAQTAEGRTDHPPERVVTPEARLFTTLRAGSNRRVFVTGDAATGDGGSGKSEFTCQLARVAASAAFEALNAGRLPVVPIRYELKNLQPNTSIFDRLKVECGLSAMDTLAVSGSLLLILDGLDELRRDAADGFNELLGDLLLRTGRCPVVLAGREASLRETWRYRLYLRPNDYYRLQPLADGKVEAFIRDFFGPNTALAEAMTGQFRNASTLVQPLLRQPFMLSMACLGVQAGQVRLPADPVQFFSTGLLHLLHRRRSRELPADVRMKLDPKDALDRLGLLAAFACESDFRFHETDAAFPAGRIAVAAMSDADVLNDLAPHSGILCVQPGGAVAEYSFSNRVIAEYLAGVYIADPMHKPTREPDDAYNTREPKVEPPSLRFFGRHVWHSQMSNVLRWLAAGWRQLAAQLNPIDRVLDWLMAELSMADDTQQTLLARLLELLGQSDEAPFRGRFNVDRVRETLTERLPPRSIFSPADRWTPMLLALPAPLNKPYIDSVVNRLDESVLDAFNVAMLAKALATVGVGRPEAVDAAVNKLTAKLDEAQLGARDVAILAEALTTVGVGRPKAVDTAVNKLSAKLDETQLDARDVVILAEALTTVGVGRPEAVDTAVNKLAAKLDESQLGARDVAMLAAALSAIGAGWSGAVDKAVDKLSAKLDEPKLSAWEVAELSETLAAVAAGRSREVDKAFEKVSAKLDETQFDELDIERLAAALAAIGIERPDAIKKAVEKLTSTLDDLDAFDLARVSQIVATISFGRAAAVDTAINKLTARLERWNSVDDTASLARALAVVGAGRPVSISKAVSKLTDKLDNSKLDADDVASLAHSLASVGAGWPDVAATLIQHGRGDLIDWPTHIVVRASRDLLFKRADRIGWREVEGLPTTPAPEPGAVVIWPNRTTQAATDDPSRLETRTGGPLPAEPEFLLARREDLTPGLDPTLCPSVDADPTTTLDEFALHLLGRMDAKRRGDAPDKNAIGALLMLLDLRELISDTFIDGRRRGTSLTKANWEQAGHRKWDQLLSRPQLDVTEVYAILNASFDRQCGTLMGDNTFAKAVRHLRDHLSGGMPPAVRDEYFLLCKDLRIAPISRG